MVLGLGFRVYGFYPGLGLNSLKGGYMGDYYGGMLGVETIAHMWNHGGNAGKSRYNDSKAGNKVAPKTQPPESWLAVKEPCFKLL